MKALLFAMLLAILQTSPPIPRKAPTNPSAGRQAVKKNSVPSAVKPEKELNASNPPPKADAQESIIVRELPAITVNTKVDWWNRSYVVLTGILVLVGIGGICVAICTLKALKTQAVIMRRQTRHIARQALSMRRQTTHLKNSVEAARSSAEATQKSIEMLINKERARIAFDVSNIEWQYPPIPLPDSPATTRVECKILFFGYTPAFIQSTSGWGFISSDKEPPTESGYMMDIPDIVSSNADLTVQKLPIWPIFMDTAKIKAIQDGREFIHFHAQIKYKDAFDRPRETTFKRRWEEADIPGLVGNWIKYGTEQDNHQT